MDRRRLPSLSSLRAFESFTRTGSMTAAGEDLHVTHGAVSRQIKALEQQLGVRLIAGPRNRLTLTKSGQRLAKSLSSAFDVIAAALPGADRSEELVISCLGTFAMKWLIPRLPRFLDAHTHVQVRITAGHDDIDFDDGRYHAAIRVGERMRARGMIGTPFLAHYHGPVLSPALLQSIDGDITKALWLPRLSSESFMAAWPNWAKATSAKLPPARSERVFERFAYLIEGAAAGLGVAVVPWAFVQPDITRGQLVAPWGFIRSTERFLFCRPSLADNRAARLFEKWLCQEGQNDTGPPLRKRRTC